MRVRSTSYFGWQHDSNLVASHFYATNRGNDAERAIDMVKTKRRTKGKIRQMYLQLTRIKIIR